MIMTWSLLSMIKLSFSLSAAAVLLVHQPPYGRELCKFSAKHITTAVDMGHHTGLCLP